MTTTGTTLMGHGEEGHGPRQGCGPDCMDDGLARMVAWLKCGIDFVHASDARESLEDKGWWRLDANNQVKLVNCAVEWLNWVVNGHDCDDFPAKSGLEFWGPDGSDWTTAKVARNIQGHNDCDLDGDNRGDDDPPGPGDNDNHRHNAADDCDWCDSLGKDIDDDERTANVIRAAWPGAVNATYWHVSVPEDRKRALVDGDAGMRVALATNRMHGIVPDMNIDDLAWHAATRADAWASITGWNGKGVGNTTPDASNGLIRQADAPRRERLDAWTWLDNLDAAAVLDEQRQQEQIDGDNDAVDGGTDPLTGKRWSWGFPSMRTGA